MTETCYMCEKKATSREHVPPKCFFPEKKDLPVGYDFRKNLIKVPSCDEHNSNKSLDDEYLMFILASTIHGNSHKERHFQEKIMRAVSRKPDTFVSFARNLRPVLVRSSSGGVEESACFSVDLKRFDSAAHHMACGLFFHHYREKWLGGFKVFSNIFMELDSKNSPEINDQIQKVCKQTANAFTGIVASGDNREIFSYRILSDNKNQHGVHMVFYEGAEITVLLR